MKNKIDYIGVLTGVSEESANGILTNCCVVSLAKNEELFSLGCINNSLYLLLSGELLINFNRDIDETIHLFRGETVGEMSVIDGSPTSAQVVASKDSTLLEIKGADFWRLINASHQFSLNMLQQLSRRVREDNHIIAEGVEERQQLIAHSVLDPMTSHYNRRWLTENGDRILTRSKMSGKPLSILMLDIDHFKQVNDQYGHQAGDTILEQVAKIIKSVIRPTDFAVRYGGEEFLVLLTETSLEDARIPANRLREQVEKSTKSTSVDGFLPAVTISCGIATNSNEINTLKNVIKEADEQLYNAKERGRNIVCG